jgi:hypothetical protein
MNIKNLKVTEADLKAGTVDRMKAVKEGLYLRRILTVARWHVT